MGRKKIYQTEEEKAEAHRIVQQNRYYRNTEKEGKPSKIAILKKENKDLKEEFNSMFLELKAENAEIKSLLLKILAK
ncbi:MAG: hypothetical protein FWF63_04565 [Fibromonadales bacterium]|nr:hypothetical protein [Fibromonadales bacterium]